VGIVLHSQPFAIFLRYFTQGKEAEPLKPLPLQYEYE